VNVARLAEQKGGVGVVWWFILRFLTLIVWSRCSTSNCRGTHAGQVSIACEGSGCCCGPLYILPTLHSALPPGGSPGFPSTLGLRILQCDLAAPRGFSESVDQHRLVSSFSTPGSFSRDLPPPSRGSPPEHTIATGRRAVITIRTLTIFVGRFEVA